MIRIDELGISSLTRQLGYDLRIIGNSDRY